jgi:hypothetical protein
VRLLFTWRFFPMPESDYHWYRVAGLAAARHGLGSLFTANPPVPMWVLSLWPPLYPVFLGLVYSVNKSLVAAPAVQALLGGLSCLVIFAAARRYAGNPWLAAGVMALHPQAIVYSAVHGSEALSLFLLCLAVWLSVMPLTARQAGCYGAALGLATLARAQVLMAMPGVVISLWRRRRALLILLGLLMLTLLPWSFNRSFIYGRPVFMNTFFGHLMYMGNYRDNMTGGYHVAPRPMEVPGNATPPEEDTYYLAAGIREILLRPAHYLMLCFRRLLTWLGVDRDEWLVRYAPRWLTALSVWAQIALFLGAVVGGVGAWRDAGARRIILPAASIVLLSILSYHMPRYSLVGLPYFAVIVSRCRIRKA